MSLSDPIAFYRGRNGNDSDNAREKADDETVSVGHMRRSRNCIVVTGYVTETTSIEPTMVSHRTSLCNGARRQKRSFIDTMVNTRRKRERT